jgi:hypothetical protein
MPILATNHAQALELTPQSVPPFWRLIDAELPTFSRAGSAERSIASCPKMTRVKDQAEVH